MCLRRGSLCSWLSTLLHSPIHYCDGWCTLKTLWKWDRALCWCSNPFHLPFFFSPWQLCPALILEIQFFPTCCDALGRLCSCLAPKTLFYHCWSLLSVSKSACGCSCSFLTRYYHFHCYITLSLPLEKKIQKEKKNQLFQTRFNFWFGTLPIKHISNPIQSPVVSLNIFQPVDRNILFQTCHQILDDHLSPCVLIT